MKKLIVSAIMLGAMATSAPAQNAPEVAKTTPVATKDDAKTKVDPAALPEAVKKTLAGEYKDWQVVEAQLVKSPSELYSLQLKKGEETMTLNLDKEGKVVKS